MKCLMKLKPTESDYEQLLENSCSLLTDTPMVSQDADELVMSLYAKVGCNYTPLAMISMYLQEKPLSD